MRCCASAVDKLRQASQASDCVFFAAATIDANFDNGACSQTIFPPHVDACRKKFFRAGRAPQPQRKPEFARVWQLYRQAFTTTCRDPFDTGASRRKIGDSDDRLVLCCRETARHRSIGWKCGRRELRCGTVGSLAGLFFVSRRVFQVRGGGSRCRRVATKVRVRSGYAPTEQQEVVMEDSQIAAALWAELAAESVRSDMSCGSSIDAVLRHCDMSDDSRGECVCAGLAEDEFGGRYSGVLGGDCGPADCRLRLKWMKRG